MNKHSPIEVLHTAGLVLLVGGAALLEPSTAVPESRVAAAAPGAAQSATAHLNFKIIIPKILYLQVGSGTDRAYAGDRVTVTSNGHSAALTASHVNLILNGAARKGIDEVASCSTGALTLAARQLVCTVSMP